MIDSLIKQQTAWSQGLSKYQKQKKCSRSEILINLSFYVYIIPKRNNYLFKWKKKKKIENGYNLKIWLLKIYIRIIIHYTDIDPSVNTRPHISCL
jgi:glycopeptide antibiotics resistance protein